MIRTILPRVFVFAVAVFLGLPQAASAQLTSDVREWTMSCGLGAVGCISWNLRLEYDPNLNEIEGFTGGSTRFKATLVNRQGTHGFVNVGPPVGAQRFDLENLRWSPPIYEGLPVTDADRFPTVTSRGAAGASNSSAPENRAPLNRAIGEWYAYGFSGEPASLYLGEFLGEQWSVYGCDPPDDFTYGVNREWGSTCGGSLTFEWTFWGEVSFTEQTTVRSSARYVTSGSLSETVVLVPEPGTYLLLLAGVVGLGFLGWAGSQRRFA